MFLLASNTGGVDAAIEGVLDKKYSPLEFRFFVGCHDYEEQKLDAAVQLGKYLPIACSRSLALKQCVSLPKPLWHEGKNWRTWYGISWELEIEASIAIVHWICRSHVFCTRNS